MAVIAATFKMWVKGIGTGKMANVELLRLLGRLQWLSRLTSLAPFMAGVYQASYHQFGKARIHSVDTVLLFSLAPWRFYCLSGLKSPASFADAAPPPHGVGRFSMGTIGHGCYKEHSCPKWITMPPHTHYLGCRMRPKLPHMRGIGPSAEVQIVRRQNNKP